MSLLKSLSSVALMTSLTRITGLLREVAIAQVLGAGMQYDLFLIAFRLPTLVRRFLGGEYYDSSICHLLSQKC